MRYNVGGGGGWPLPLSWMLSELDDVRALSLLGLG
jgi:hypothetical protein